MAPEQEWAARLLWAAPHLLLLRGQLVLHASAVQHPDGVVAFCGASGFGKTTLAHLFAAQGTQLLSEDLVVVSLQGPVPEVMVDGEALIRRWVAAQAPGLANQRQIDTEELSGVTDGLRSRLREILFLRRTGQAAPTIRRESLPHADALVLMLENSFAELGQPAVWARVLEGSCRLVRETSMGCAHLPEGLELLAEAVAGYNWTVN